MADFYGRYPVSGGGGGGSGITSINGDTNPAQLIVGGTGISVATVVGTTTITNTSPMSATGNLTDVGTDGIVITGGTGAVVGSGTSLAQHVADSTHNGYLSSTDWTTFNNKQSTITAGNLTDAGTDGIVVTGGTGAVIGSGTSLAQHVADSTHNGYLSSTDWSTFNNKQSTITTGNFTDAGTDGIVVTGGTGAVIGSGTSIAQHVADSTHNGYLSSTDWTTFNGKLSTALTSAHLLVGNGSNIATDVAVSGDLTLANTGAFTIANSAVTNAKMANMADQTIKGNNTGGSAAPVDLTAAQTRVVVGKAMTVQRLSGSGTYTTPAGVLYLRVKMQGGGGGGGGAGSATNNGADGSDCTFGSSLLTASKGVHGVGASSGAGGAGGAGGTNTINSPATSIVNSPGGAGGAGQTTNNNMSFAIGGSAGISFGGASGTPGQNGGNGGSAKQFSGSGGGGGSSSAAASNGHGGGGGGAGAYQESLIVSPSATYAYVVGGGGSGGSGGAGAGGDGGDGALIVEEHYL